MLFLVWNDVSISWLEQTSFLINKSLIEMPTITPPYMEGSNTFLYFSFTNSSVMGEIVCQCLKCNFSKWYYHELVYEYLIIKHFLKRYIMWLPDRERRGSNIIDEIHVMSQENDEIIPNNNLMCYMINDALGIINTTMAWWMIGKRVQSQAIIWMRILMISF